MGGQLLTNTIHKYFPTALRFLCLRNDQVPLPSKFLLRRSVWGSTCWRGGVRPACSARGPSGQWAREPEGWHLAPLQVIAREVLIKRGRVIGREFFNIHKASGRGKNPVYKNVLETFPGRFFGSRRPELQ